MDILPRNEVVKRLRQRDQPIRMFGESDEDSYQRLIRLEMSDREGRVDGTDFREAMNKFEQGYLNVINEATSSTLEVAANNADVKTTDLNTSIEELTILVKELNTTPGFKPDESVTINDCEIILKFLRFLLERWGKRLNARKSEEKTSLAGKKESAIYTQTQAYLKPMFKLLRSHKISNDVLRLLKVIVKELVERNYIKANESYLDLSIGNAPWPIGVTMVGIHARTGREKISQNNIAHALNDDTQRKYIQGLKRLMTQCQILYPTDPSRSF